MEGSDESKDKSNRGLSFHGLFLVNEHIGKIDYFNYCKSQVSLESIAYRVITKESQIHNSFTHRYLCFPAPICTAQ